jgi:hypothetical protein
MSSEQPNSTSASDQSTQTDTNTNAAANSGGGETPTPDDSGKEGSTSNDVSDSQSASTVECRNSNDTEHSVPSSEIFETATDKEAEEYGYDQLR